MSSFGAEAWAARTVFRRSCDYMGRSEFPPLGDDPSRIFRERLLPRPVAGVQRPSLPPVGARGCVSLGGFGMSVGRE